MIGKAKLHVTPGFLERFQDYLDRHPDWGCLHFVLGCGNLKDGAVDAAFEAALACDDEEGCALALILRALSVTQRRKIMKRCVSPVPPDTESGRVSGHVVPVQGTVLVLCGKCRAGFASLDAWWVHFTACEGEGPGVGAN